MKYVIDSSVAFKWVVTEPDTDKAQQLRGDFCNGVHELLAPDIFLAESAIRSGHDTEVLAESLHAERHLVKLTLNGKERLVVEVHGRPF